MKDCIFCNRENLVTDTVYEDEQVMAFMDIEPINEGQYCLSLKSIIWMWMKFRMK